MQNAASKFIATRNGFVYVKPKLFIIKHDLIKKSFTKNQLLEQVNKTVDSKIQSHIYLYSTL